MSANKRIAALLGAAVMSTPLACLGTDFDGSKPLICATMEAHDCNAGESCARGLPQSVGAPVFMRINFAEKTIAGTKRTTPIVSMNKNAEQLLLQGTELGYAWTIAIEVQDGSLSASMINKDTVFVLFGSCTPL